MKSKSLILALAAMLAVAGTAYGQVNRITGPGVLDAVGASKSNNDGELNTYSATATGIVPPVSATDVACLGGSATKTVRVTRVTVSGTAATLVTLPVTLVLRNAANTGGTAGTGASAFQGAAHTSAQAVNTALATSYTAVPVTGGIQGTVYGATLTLPVTSAGTVSLPWQATYGGRGGAKAPVLVGTSQWACVHFTSTSVSSGVVAISFEWTEE